MLRGRRRPVCGADYVVPDSFWKEVSGDWARRGDQTKRKGKKGKADNDQDTQEQTQEGKERRKATHTDAEQGEQEGKGRKGKGRERNPNKTRPEKNTTTSDSKTRAYKRKHTRNRTPDKTDIMGNRDYEHTQKHKEDTLNEIIFNTQTRHDRPGKDRKHATQNLGSNPHSEFVFVTRSSSVLSKLSH